MSQRPKRSEATPRRRFLSSVSWAALGSGLLARGRLRGADREPAPPRPPDALPDIRIGPHRISRLVAGWNPIGGYSYMGPHLDQHMREYFTPEQTVEFLLSCERAGITAHQFSHPDRMADVLRRARDRGSKMRFLCLHAAAAEIESVVRETKPIAIVHHGGVTDRLFRQGKSQEVRDFVHRVHDAGVLAGVSAHDPDCIRRVADEGWKVDLFMTCFYHITRTPEETAKLGPLLTVPVGRPFFAADPDRMTEVMRSVDTPCLGFKILAAGRFSAQRGAVRDGFRYAFERIKPTDGVIVGMYPRFRDEIAENAGYVRELGAARPA